MIVEKKYDQTHSVDPETDLSVLCPNCHAMVHRRKDKTLSMKQLKELLEGKK